MSIKRSIAHLLENPNDDYSKEAKQDIAKK